MTMETNMTDIEVRAADVRRVVGAALADAGDRVEATAGAIRRLLEDAGHVADVLVTGTKGLRSIGLVNGVWSPSLHPATADTFVIREGATDDAILDLLSTPIARQVRACEDARRHGVPWRPVADQCALGHLHVDRTLLAILGGRGMKSMVDQLRAAIVSLHPAASVRYGGSGILSAFGNDVREVEEGNGAMRVLTLSTVARRDPWCHFDGTTLSLSGIDLPDTVLTVMAGRPIGDLIAINEDIDPRIVENASRSTPRGVSQIDFALVPDHVRLADVL